MKVGEKTKEQLINELEEALKRIAALEEMGTERKRAEDALKESEAQFRRLVDNAADAFYLVRLDGKIVDVNKHACEALGYSRDELLSLSVSDVDVAWNLQDLDKLFSSLSSDEPVNIEGVHRRKDGSTLPVEIRLSVFESGGKQHFLALARDITERKRAEEALRKSEENYRSIFNSVNDAISVHNVETGEFVDVNQKWTEMLGYTREEARHLRIEDISSREPPHTQEDSVKLLKRAAEGESLLFDWIHIDKAGRLFWTDVYLKRTVIGENERILAVLHDITERKRAEEMIIRSEKLASLGRLTAGVSHEVLNPLNFILLCVQRLARDPDIDPELAEDLREIETHANRITKISQDLLSFSRQRAPERRPININETVTKTLALLEYDLKLQNIAVEFQLAEDLPPILADEDQLQQVVLNLLTNARDVMPKGGRLVLSTSEEEPVFADKEGTVELRVEDTGPGIPPGEMDKLFEPFFTTKPVGEGTGLGLSVCQGIVEAHGGSIWAENVSEGGAAFIVRLNEGRKNAEQDISG